MNTKTIAILGIIVIILSLAFITNPDKEKHVNYAVEKIINEENGEDLGILGGLVDTFLKPTLAPKIKVENYYLFSISQLSSKDKKRRVNLGLGVFGQVIPLATTDEINKFRSIKEKAITKEAMIGTYQFNKDNTLKVIAINSSRLKFRLELYNGRNMGSIEGVANLYKNEAKFTSYEFGICRLKITFEKNKAIIQTTSKKNECGFGNGVIADNIYKKIN